MTEFDMQRLLMPVDGDDPCGEALDYDLQFLALEVAAGTGGEDGEPPDWEDVAKLGLDLAMRSKDLRVGVLLARAGLNREGLAGLRRGLELLAGYVEEFWDGMHPRPDPEEGADQTVRLSALANLCDPEGMLAELRRLPLARSRLFGRFGLRDWAEAQRADATEPDLATVTRAFEDSEPERLAVEGEAAEACLATVARLDAAIRARIGPTEAVRLEPLTAVLGQVLQLLAPYRSPAHLPVQEGGATASDAPGRAAPTGGDIRDRSDVIGAIDRICQWYRANEPASPVPVLLLRARRLVSKDFLALLMDLAPDGAAQFRALAGAGSEAD